MGVKPSVTSRTGYDLLAIGLAGFLIIEERQEAQALPLAAYPARDSVATPLAQELGGLALKQPHVSTIQARSCPCVN
jgi:hypothetical protein